MQIEKNLQRTIKDLKERLKEAKSFNTEAKRSRALQVMVQCSTVKDVIIHIKQLDKEFNELTDLWYEANEVLDRSYK